MLNGNLDTPCRGVDSSIIKALYRALLPEFIGSHHVFMYHNALIYRAQIIHSPDLNPIENLWALLKTKIYEIL